ncbi:DUF29 domain-containing protein [Candidatus Methylospira mobilis]|uniref:DUF29 domain-containing protein n=1 Tax=Candidatus Methylospira mobilis TaxID=1808979 RepID=UPI0028EAE710|nr:DUF29 domain-containing protein [Candidatus Methylospira mobilis]WNV06387.1 DUF29 domain-containing protein [Candidatus Methylospira mobilis]
MSTVLANYNGDVIAWANEQAQLLRAGQFSQLDIEHIADEIEDVGRSEQRELASRMTVLIAHLLKWRYQPERKGNSWRLTIEAQREDTAYVLKKMPSLKQNLNDDQWLSIIWKKAKAQAIAETGLENLPDDYPWTMDQILNPDFWPEA